MRRGAIVARVVMALDLLLLAVALVLGVTDGTGDGQWIFIVIFGAMVVGLSAIGSLIVARQHGNAVGWLFLGSSLGIALSTASFNYLSLSVDRYGLALPGTIFAAWLNSWIVIPNLIVLVIFVPLLFPTGRLPSPRWRPVAVFALLGIVFTTIGSAMVPGPLERVNVDNPVGLLLPHPLLEIVGAIDAMSGVLVFSLTAVALVARYRHGSQLERLQLRWFAYPATVAIVGIGTSSVGGVGPLGDVAWTAALVSVAAMPIAIGIAILRHRLFDIDLVIKRTISYAVLSVLLIGLEVAGILVLGELLTIVIGDQTQTLAIALSTLAVAAIFQPARRRIQDWVERRFDRSRYDASQVVAGFSARLRDRVDLEAVRGELTATAVTALRPVSADVWLRIDRPT